MYTPCDAVDYDEKGNPVHKCPYEDTYTGYVSEMCRVMCGLGVDEDSYPEYEDE